MTKDLQRWCWQNLKNIVINEVDSSNGVIFPMYDPDTNMVFLCGKVSRISLHHTFELIRPNQMVDVSDKQADKE